MVYIYVLMAVLVMANYVVEVMDKFMDEGFTGMGASMGVVDSFKFNDVEAKVRYTLAGVEVRRVYSFTPELVAIWDVIMAEDNNTKVDACRNMIDLFKAVSSKIGDDYANSLISDLEGYVGQMRYVSDGDYVLSQDTNLPVDYTCKSLDLLKHLYELFKAKTGRTLSNVEYWIAMAETRAGMMRRVAFGDFVLTKDHNLVIDTLKVIEVAVREINKNV
jgi:hypothetical protein